MQVLDQNDTKEIQKHIDDTLKGSYALADKKTVTLYV